LEWRQAKIGARREPVSSIDWDRLTKRRVALELCLHRDWLSAQKLITSQAMDFLKRNKVGG
jgi:hypothetical protein